MRRAARAISKTLSWLLPLASACGARGELQHVVDPKALGPYSSAVCAGPMIHVAGKIGDPSLDVRQQAELAIDAVAATLQPLGVSLDRVVSATVYLVDMADYAAVNEVWRQRFKAPYPARACIAVAALPRGAKVEVQVIAMRE